jgi:hypothetical protein
MSALEINAATNKTTKRFIPESLYFEVYEIDRIISRH